MSMYAANFYNEPRGPGDGWNGRHRQRRLRALARAGVRVVSADLAIAGNAQVDEGIERIALDVTSATQVRACVDDVVARHGRLDILVNVAGIVSVGNAQDLPEAEWDRVVDINLKALSFVARRSSRR